MPNAEPSIVPPGATAVRHEGHVDYLDGGHLLHPEGDHVEEHVIAISSMNPDRCDPARRVEARDGHRHGPDCGHEQVPHGDHIDFLVDGRLQHQHGDHIDDHGPLKLA